MCLLRSKSIAYVCIAQFVYPIHDTLIVGGTCTVFGSLNVADLNRWCSNSFFKIRIKGLYFTQYINYW